MISDVAEFLAYAVRLERDGAARLKELGDAMDKLGKARVRNVFRQLEHFSRLHHQGALDMCHDRGMTEKQVRSFTWPHIEAPESIPLADSTTNLKPLEALDLALTAEKRARKFYKTVASSSGDSQVKTLAAEFAAEEDEHIAELKQWIKRAKKGSL